MLDLSTLAKALASLERAINRTREAADDEELRDAVIQRFEYTYELSWKMLRQQLEQIHPSPSEITQASFKEFTRIGAEYQLIQHVEAWFEYRRMRNITAHTYDEEKAGEVYKTAVAFFKDAQDLLKKLEERNVAP